jgi:hypothetical protein
LFCTNGNFWSQGKGKAIPLQAYDDINPLTPELNPSAQRCLQTFFAGDFNF